MKLVKKNNGVNTYEKTGRPGGMKLHWTHDMLTFIKNHFPTTTNTELAECLGVSTTTVSTKARELGLKKAPEHLRRYRREGAIAARLNLKKSGQPHHRLGKAPTNRFKHGQQWSREVEAKRVAGIKKYNLLHPEEVRARAQRALKTRILNLGK